jgi:uncharacterized membrane protein
MESNSMPQASAVAAAMPAASELPLSPNAMSALSYFFAPAAIAALVMKQYENQAEVRFNAMQSLLLSGTVIMGSIALGILTGILTALASLIFGALKLYGVMAVVLTAVSGFSGLLSLSVFGLWVALIISAANGKRFMVPYLGDMAERMAKR